MTRMNDGMMSSHRLDWETPQPFFDIIDAEFHFTLDAAATDDNAKVARYHTIADDGLSQRWPGVVWVNPPYGRSIGKWVAKGYAEAQQGATVVMLIPSRTDTRYWHDYVMRAAEVRLIRGRLVFVEGYSNAPFPSALVVFRPGEHHPTFTAIGRGILLRRVAP